MRETQQVIAQILKHEDEDDGVYLTSACYIMEDQRKGYEVMSRILPSQYGLWWPL